MKNKEAERLKAGDEVVYQGTRMFLNKTTRGEQGVELHLSRSAKGKVTAVVSPRSVKRVPL